jgi:ATP-dependent Lhr-like helicase
VSRHLAERLGEQNVAAHHGSLTRNRFDAEQRLKAGKLKVMVATASLELGIDIGDVELMPARYAALDLRVPATRGPRQSFPVNGIPKGRIFPSSRDELVDRRGVARCRARVSSTGCTFRITRSTYFQQIVAEVAAREYGEDELFRS